MTALCVRCRGWCLAVLSSAKVKISLEPSPRVPRHQYPFVSSSRVRVGFGFGHFDTEQASVQSEFKKCVYIRLP